MFILPILLDEKLGFENKNYLLASYFLVKIIHLKTIKIARSPLIVLGKSKEQEIKLVWPRGVRVKNSSQPNYRFL